MSIKTILTRSGPKTIFFKRTYEKGAKVSVPFGLEGRETVTITAGPRKPTEDEKTGSFPLSGDIYEWKMGKIRGGTMLRYIKPIF